MKADSVMENNTKEHNPPQKNSKLENSRWLILETELRKNLKRRKKQAYARELKSKTENTKSEK